MAVKNGVPDPVLGDEYPFEDRYVELDDGHQMHYIEAGRQGRRPTLLLLHGNPTWSYLYRRFMLPLSRHARVIAVDHVGFGRSDHPEAGYHSIDRHVANLECFAREKGLKRIVPVVHDWGGPFGLGFAQRTDRLAGLVIMNTWAFVDRVPMRLPLWYKALLRGRLGRHLVGRRNLAIRALPRLMPVDAATQAAYEHPFPNPASRGALVAMPAMVPDRPDHPEHASMQRIEEGLPGLDVPARILWADKDPAFGFRYAKAFHAVLPNAEYPQTIDAGHFLQEEKDARLVTEIQDFTRHL